MPAVEVTVDIGDVDTGLSAMERRARALGPVMKDLAKPMKADQREHRKEKSGPDGSWAPRSAATIARAHGKRKLARSMLGRLPSAVQYKVTASSITGTSRVRWSGAHQDGDRVGHGARLPARTFLWLSDGFQTQAASTIAAALLASYGGG